METLKLPLVAILKVKEKQDQRASFNKIVWLNVISFYTLLLYLFSQTVLAILHKNYGGEFSESKKDVMCNERVGKRLFIFDFLIILPICIEILISACYLGCMQHKIQENIVRAYRMI